MVDSIEKLTSMQLRDMYKYFMYISLEAKYKYLRHIENEYKMYKSFFGTNLYFPYRWKNS